MNIEQFKKEAHQMVDWMAEYFESVEKYPVKAKVKPGDIKAQLPKEAPEKGESFETIMEDFERIIMPGMTHWHSPNFYAYFPGNKSRSSVIGEMLTTALGAQCMSWITSPSAAELEETVMEWLRDILGLPKHFTGVIQDTASTATLCAILSARENLTDFSINEHGFSTGDKFTVYSSEHVHSSIDKAVRIAGIGSANLRKVPVDQEFAMIPDELERMIEQDIKDGFKPLCVVSAVGTTSTTAIDPVKAISHIAIKYKLWHHVDAAYAGTALMLPEMRWMAEGVEMADSFVVNPHKWMFTNFDCTAYFVKDTKALINTFSMTPEYLKTAEDQKVNNYRDWGIQLGRRFRALKLWFVIRDFGINGMQEKLRNHLELASWFKDQLMKRPDFEVLAPVHLNLICFRYVPDGEDDLNSLNQKLMDSLNESGKMFLSHTVLNDKYTLRIVFGNTDVERRHVESTWDFIQKTAQQLTEAIT
ncbi:pyridoxal-dependent decarboxylase [Fulvivirgaceae bacterium BMA10]|uniref:Pyridoxal-dependent decarboxylase n=1 Tax=Splendidivirga corallicola TaxID=3051826 RepID=A0ABT8KPD9_9BACT|nr:pyridoxal-dependent decarboxylase [Fulvivirgaceae bacterium BMA10]